MKTKAGSRWARRSKTHKLITVWMDKTLYRQFALAANKDGGVSAVVRRYVERYVRAHEARRQKEKADGRTA